MLTVVALTFVGAAQAACLLRQAPTRDGVRVELEAQAEPLSCRLMSFSSQGPPLSAKAWIEDESGRRRRLPKDQLVRSAEGLQVAAPDLMPGGRLEIEVEVPGEDLVVMIGDFEPLPAVETHLTRSLLLDEKHPGWAFADPTLGSTLTETRTLGPDGATRVELPGVAARDWVQLRPGSFTLMAPATDISITVGPGVTESRVSGGWRFDAPAGGSVRYCIRAVGADLVIPDQRTFVAGTEWHFRQVSLPEPAVPVRLAGMRDRVQLRQLLYDEVRALVRGALPATDPMRPRQLNRAWRSGWASDVEKALILQRFLWQEKIGAEWVMTGSAPDPVTLTGYDTLLLRTSIDGDELWLDPSCDSCRPGEIGTRWMGQPAVGPVREVPKQPGRLTRKLSLVGESFTGHFLASGAAGLYLREAAGAVPDDQRPAAIAAALGMPGATLDRLEGLDEAGADVTVVLQGPSAKDPFPPGTSPWEGGWADE